MPFKASQFERAKFEPRRETVEVPTLAAWFDEGEPAQWVVRGLSSSELHVALQAEQRNSSVETIVRAISANGDQATTIRKALGLAGDTPGEIAKRLEMLVAGSVEPKITLPIAVKLAEAFPIEFLLLTNAITRLCGQGAEVGKPESVSEPTPA